MGRGRNIWMSKTWFNISGSGTEKRSNNNVTKKRKNSMDTMLLTTTIKTR